MTDHARTRVRALSGLGLSGYILKRLAVVRDGPGQDLFRGRDAGRLGQGLFAEAR